MFLYLLQFSRRSTCLANGIFKPENYPSVKIPFSYMGVTILISLEVEDIVNKKNQYSQSIYLEGTFYVVGERKKINVPKEVGVVGQSDA